MFAQYKIVRGILLLGLFLVGFVFINTNLEGTQKEKNSDSDDLLILGKIILKDPVDPKKQIKIILDPTSRSVMSGDLHVEGDIRSKTIDSLKSDIIKLQHELSIAKADLQKQITDIKKITDNIKVTKLTHGKDGPTLNLVQVENLLTHNVYSNGMYCPASDLLFEQGKPIDGGHPGAAINIRGVMNIKGRVEIDNSKEKGIAILVQGGLHLISAGIRVIDPSKRVGGENGTVYGPGGEGKLGSYP